MRGRPHRQCGYLGILLLLCATPGCILSRLAYDAMVPEKRKPVEIAGCSASVDAKNVRLSLLATAGKNRWTYRFPLDLHPWYVDSTVSEPLRRRQGLVAGNLPCRITTERRPAGHEIVIASERLTSDTHFIRIASGAWPAGTSQAHRLDLPRDPQRGRKAAFALVAPFVAIADVLATPFFILAKPFIEARIDN